MKAHQIGGCPQTRWRKNYLRLAAGYNLRRVAQVRTQWKMLESYVKRHSELQDILYRHNYSNQSNVYSI